jgi:hypothetical protein
MTLNYKLYRTSKDQLIEATQAITMLPSVEMQAFLLRAIEVSESKTPLEKLKLKGAWTQLRHIEAAVVYMDAVMKTLE